MLSKGFVLTGPWTMCKSSWPEITIASTLWAHWHWGVSKEPFAVLQSLWLCLFFWLDCGSLRKSGWLSQTDSLVKVSHLFFKFGYSIHVVFNDCSVLLVHTNITRLWIWIFSPFVSDILIRMSTYLHTSLWKVTGDITYP